MAFIYSLISIDVPFSSLDTNIDTAFNYFKEIYPGIQKTDRNTFIYRDIEFNYFQSGISMDPNKPGTYILLDKDNYKIWLYSYDNKEDRWNDYLKTKKEWLELIEYQNKEYKKLLNPPSFFKRIIQYITGVK